MEIQVGARHFIESTCREGGLSSLQFNTISGQEGTHLHRLFFQKLDQLFPQTFYQTEVSLQGQYQLDDVKIQLQGRADVCLEIEGEQQILEAKSYNGSLKTDLFKGEEIHWAQALLYTCLLHRPQANGMRCFTYHLAYLSVEAAEPFLLQRQTTEQEAFVWLENLLAVYVQKAQHQQIFLQVRDQSAQQLRFPFAQLRPGQKELMEACLKAIRQRLPLIAQAPTGTGKTMSNLYPALKAQANHLIGKIFYLTAKIATRQVAAEALEILRSEGLVVRSIILKAKEQLCLCPELYCDTKICPFAVSYYDNLPQALSKALSESDFRPDFIQEIAREFSVCPFELSLDISLFCDVIIGDYSHFFDPRIKLLRFFEESREQHLLLLDEAHNLPSRTVEMFSASLSLQTVYKAKQNIEMFDSGLAAKMQRFIQYLSFLAQALLKDEPGFDKLEPKITPDMVLKAPQLRAVRSPLPHLRRFLFSLIPLFRHCLDQIEEHKMKRPILDFYFELLFFVRVQDEFWNESYITIFKQQANDVSLTLRCQDSSPMLLNAYRNKHIPIFFSATLHPLPYYQAMFSAENENHRPDILSLASPFPQENLLVLIYDQLKTTYREREKTMPEAAKIIAAATKAKQGNYLVYFPSYAYLQKVSDQLYLLPELKDVHLLLQKPGMTEEQKERFLQAFMEPQKNQTTIGLAVLGGSFGEGIDLVGDRLSGVIIIGVGLPQMNPERNILQSYFDDKLQQGFHFAYLYPAFTKIVQAAGRVIRSEGDIGFILLCDERYIKPEYRQLLPEEWKPWRVQDSRVIHKALQKFYRDCGLVYHNEEERKAGKVSPEETAPKDKRVAQHRLLSDKNEFHSEPAGNSGKMTITAAKKMTAEENPLMEDPAALQAAKLKLAKEILAQSRTRSTTKAEVSRHENTTTLRENSAETKATQAAFVQLLENKPDTEWKNEPKNKFDAHFEDEFGAFDEWEDENENDEYDDALFISVNG